MFFINHEILRHAKLLKTRFYTGGTFRFMAFDFFAVYLETSQAYAENNKTSYGRKVVIF